ncbi:hypothetical protein MSWHS_1520 [Methanosarcina sp. WWM596]|nr:hypothetical protein MSWHS_1520 [Methanosarcina sp. WWM596]
MNEKHPGPVRQIIEKIGLSVLILVFLILLGTFVFYTVQSYSSLIPSNYTQSNLTQSNLIQSNLTQSNLTQSNLTQSNLTQSSLIQPNFTQSNLTQPNLTQSNLTQSNLTQPNLTQPNLTQSNLIQSNLTQPNLTQSSLIQPNLTQPNLTQSSLIQPNLTQSNLTQSYKTVYVGDYGSENFTCDGIDDQVEINQALEYVAENPQFTTVYLRGPNTYVISDSIFIGSQTTLVGDPTAVIKLKDKADWPVGKPLITQMDWRGVHGVIIKGFEIDGNHDNNEDKKKGLGYYNMIHFLNSRDIQVHDMYMHDGHGEGLKADHSYNIQFYNNNVYKLGHNGLFAISCQNVEAWNNTITCRTDSGLRATNSNHIKFYDNLIDSFYHWSAGSSGILIEKTAGTVNDVEIYNNTIHNTYGPGLWLIGWSESYSRKEAQNVHIYHNIFYSTGTNPNIDWVGGIITSGFYDTLIENNIFDGVYHAAVIHMYPTGTHIYPTYDDHPNLSPTGTGYATIVRNNIIVNTRERKKDPEGTGYAVINYLPETQTFVLENNCLYNNSAGNYQNCTSTTDIYADPLFVNQNEHDYCLKPDSPCIGAGYTFPISSETFEEKTTESIESNEIITESIESNEKTIKSIIRAFVSQMRKFLSVDTSE